MNLISYLSIRCMRDSTGRAGLTGVEFLSGDSNTTKLPRNFLCWGIPPGLRSRHRQVFNRDAADLTGEL